MGDGAAGLARVFGMLVLSTGAHVAVAFVLIALPLARELIPNEPQMIEIVAIDEPLPPEPEPEPVVEEPEPPPPEPEAVRPEPRRVERTEPRPSTPEPQPEPPSAEPPPVEEAIADFTGETLTNEGGETFAMPVGNGAPMDGPIGQPGAVVTGRRREGGSGGAIGGSGTAAPEGPRVVALADLSRRPSPQGDMNAVLQRNYPPRARQLGIEGRVVIGFRIMPDGSVQRFRTRSETPPSQGFGEACRRTVQQLRWDPPLAQDGAAVATDASFECEFAVGL
ncbi:energy transducer TonB [Sandaracinus amylolyticus]|uniref:Ferric siderophore transport system, periplasmic binding protein TonB n=1 Tax=Sandaracinus amylolyticus TaxID=927083 RepID=A0A0F6YHH5_9BACT|nr:energy transducer TonB [Sandaracinus amylolyticus]AKF05663.1 Ferric siderophore transport system, periplasmic binding protein TonB [Sandaracinus amylolyticus]